MTGRDPAAPERVDGPAPVRPVVVTGIGYVGPLGIGGGDHVAKATARGESCLGPIRAFPTAGWPSHLGGEVGDVGPHLQADEERRLPRVSQLAVVAARQALVDAGLEPGAVAGLGLVLGSHWGDFRSSEAFARGFLARGPLGLSPLIFPSTVMNTMAAHVSMAVGARGPMLTLNQAGGAGDAAVARAAGLIRAGRATAALAGGVDELCEVLYRELARLGIMSASDPGPEGCWPFDRRANGTVLGEGATVLLLEAADQAAARGARAYAEIAGAAWGNLPARAHGFPSRQGRDAAVIRRALAAAGVEAGDIDVACLTGSGDPEQDACELDLLEDALGATARPRLTAVTPLCGEHGGTGALRVAVAALALADGRLPPLPDLREPIRALDFVTPARVKRQRARSGLVHGLARGGDHVALVLRPAPAAG